MAPVAAPSSPTPPTPPGLLIAGFGCFRAMGHHECSKKGDMSDYEDGWRRTIFSLHDPTLFLTPDLAASELDGLRCYVEKDGDADFYPIKDTAHMTGVMHTEWTNGTTGFMSGHFVVRDLNADRFLDVTGDKAYAWGTWVTQFAKGGPPDAVDDFDQIYQQATTVANSLLGDFGDPAEAAPKYHIDETKRKKNGGFKNAWGDFWSLYAKQFAATELNPWESSWKWPWNWRWLYNEHHL